MHPSFLWISYERFLFLEREKDETKASNVVKTRNRQNSKETKEVKFVLPKTKKQTKAKDRSKQRDKVPPKKCETSVTKKVEQLAVDTNQQKLSADESLINSSSVNQSSLTIQQPARMNMIVTQAEALFQPQTHLEATNDTQIGPISLETEIQTTKSGSLEQINGLIEGLIHFKTLLESMYSVYLTNFYFEIIQIIVIGF